MLSKTFLHMYLNGAVGLAACHVHGIRPGVLPKAAVNHTWKNLPWNLQPGEISRQERFIGEEERFLVAPPVWTNPESP